MLAPKSQPAAFSVIPYIIVAGLRRSSRIATLRVAPATYTSADFNRHITYRDGRACLKCAHVLADRTSPVRVVCNDEYGLGIGRVRNTTCACCGWLLGPFEHDTGCRRGNVYRPIGTDCLLGMSFGTPAPIASFVICRLAVAIDFAYYLPVPYVTSYIRPSYKNAPEEHLPINTYT